MQFYPYNYGEETDWSHILAQIVTRMGRHTYVSVNLGTRSSSE